MTTKHQLLKSIEETEQQLKNLKTELENHKTPTIQEAKVGDTLEDGSIVVKKENGLALLIAPKRTEVECSWSKEFEPVFDKLEKEGFNPSQWFVPTIEQLKLACGVLKHEKYANIWSSIRNNNIAGYVSFPSGLISMADKSSRLGVRPFRCVVY